MKFKFLNLIFFKSISLICPLKTKSPECSIFLYVLETIDNSFNIKDSELKFP